MIRIRPALLAFVLIALTDLAWSGDTTDRGAAILQHARNVLRDAGQKPLQQTAKFTALTGPKPVVGTYRYASNGSVLGDEVEIADYREVRVRAGNSEKIRRALEAPPLAVYVVFEALRAERWLQLRSDDRIRRVSSRKIEKMPANCVQIEGKGGDHSICVYDDGTLATMYMGTGGATSLPITRRSIMCGCRGKSEFRRAIRRSPNY